MVYNTPLGTFFIQYFEQNPLLAAYLHDTWSPGTAQTEKRITNTIPIVGSLFSEFPEKGSCLVLGMGMPFFGCGYACRFTS